MAKKKYEVRLKSWGIYSLWDAQSKSLPSLIKVTRDIPCELDIEFGYVLNIKKAKNRKLQHYTYHPNIPDEDGKPMAPFIGEVYIKDNDWDFFIGDNIWAPIETKKGDWRIAVAIDGEMVADEVFTVF